MALQVKLDLNNDPNAGCEHPRYDKFSGHEGDWLRSMCRQASGQPPLMCILSLTIRRVSRHG